MAEVVMPRLSDSMEEGTILRWLKAEGEPIARGDELVEIETDKATMTYAADQDGVLSIVAQEGETLPIGSVIARIGGGGSDGGDNGAAAGVTAAPAGAAGAAAAAVTAAPAAAGVTAAPAAAGVTAAPAAAGVTSGEPLTAPLTFLALADGAAPGTRVKASPVARRIARERGIDLATVRGSGPGGRIVKADVEGAAPAAPRTPAAPGAPGAPAAPAAAPAPAPAMPAGVPEPATAKGAVTVVQLTRTQQVVGRRMAESKATIPDFTLQAEVDMEGCVAMRSELKDLGAQPLPTYNDMIVKACALALREHPRANGSYRDGHFELYARVNVGVAVAAQDALIVPTVFDADAKSLTAIAGDTQALVARVRDASITPPELSGGTFTVSNLGMYSVTSFKAVINPPQAAILSVGSLASRAVVRDGDLVARHTMNVTLACDHRILYGAEAAKFLARIRALLERPLGLAL